MYQFYLQEYKNLLNRTYHKKEKESKIQYKGISLDILKSTITYNEKNNRINKNRTKNITLLI